MVAIQDGVEAHVFWKQIGPAAGPCCSVFVLGHELIKFDCYEGELGHFHVALPARAGSTSNILRFGVSTIEQQIERTAFELSHNLIYYCERCVHPQVRTFELNQPAVSEAVPKIRQALSEALDASKKATK